MQVKILGGHGGVSKTCLATSYLIDDTLLIDAGSVASTLNVSEQLKIENILISHAHLDHIKDLAFICDNCFGQKTSPFKVYLHKTSKDAVLKHLFNDIIWPDFTQLPSKEQAIIQFHEIESAQSFSLGEYSITPINVGHPGDAQGFIIEKNNCAILFTMDTGPTELIWQEAMKVSNLKAVFTEVSFPNHLQNVANVSFHHTPNSFLREMQKIPKDVPIFLGHLKPAFEQQLVEEIRALKNDRLHILPVDGDRFTF